MKNKLVILLVMISLIITLAASAGCSTGETTSAVTTAVTTAVDTAAAIATPAPANASAPAPAAGSSGELLIFAAGGTKIAVDEAATLFEEQYGTKITINYGGGGEVLSNMVIAKKGDIYIAPEQRFMDTAVKKGALNSTGEAAGLAYMIPVIGVKKGNPQNIRSIADLAQPGLKIVMGNPETTALGIIVPEMLQKASVYDEVNANIVANAPQVNSIVTMLKMSQVDAGFIWHYFGTTAADDVDIIWVPPEYVTGIGIIQAAVTNYTTDAALAGQFVDFMTSPAVKEVFKKYGYIVDREEADKLWTGE